MCPVDGTQGEDEKHLQSSSFFQVIYSFIPVQYGSPAVNVFLLNLQFKNTKLFGGNTNIHISGLLYILKKLSK